MVLLQVKEVVAEVTSVTPTSIVGWGGLFGIISFFFLVFDRVTNRGKNLATLTGKIDGLCEKMEDFEHTQAVMDTRIDTLTGAVRDLTFELKGTDGTNGMKSIVREHTRQLKTINDRNLVRDEIERRDRENYPGPERRKDVRREIDRPDEGEGAE